MVKFCNLNYYNPVKEVLKYRFCITGNSTSAILEGQATLTLLPRGEAYVVSSDNIDSK